MTDEQKDKQHHCSEYDKWTEFERRVYFLAYSHGVTYPKDYPRFKFCPFCGNAMNAMGVTWTTMG